MKKSTKFIVGLLLLSFLFPTNVDANENILVIGEPDEANNQLNFTNRNMVQEQQNAPFEAKTSAEREQLPQKEQEIVDQIEQYLTKNSNPNARNFGSTLNKLIASLVFDVTIRRDNTMISDLAGLTGTSETSAWFENVAGKSDRFLTVFDEPT